MSEQISQADKSALYADLLEEAGSENIPMEPKFALPDPVNHPSHYCNGGIECIDAIKAATSSVDGYQGFLAGNAIKYIWRHNLKGKPVEDLQKAKFYLDKLISTYNAEAL